MEELFKHHILLRQGTEQGSGVIYYPIKQAYALIITAKHVLKSQKILGTQIEQIQHIDGRLVSLDLSSITGAKILHAKDCDIACIVIRRDKFEEITGALPSLSCLNTKFDFKQCRSIGYPKQNDLEIKAIKSVFRNYSESENSLIESTLYDEDLETLTSSSHSNLQGMSGGGLFFTDDRNYYLSGILSKFSDNYRDFISVSLEKVNEFLEDNGLSLLPVTYASTIGLNEVWFRNHITQKIDQLGERYTKKIESFDLPAMQMFAGLAVGDVFREALKLEYHKFISEVKQSIRHFNQDEVSDFKLESEELLAQLKCNFYDTPWNVAEFGLNELLPKELKDFQKVIEDTNRQLYQLRKEKIKDLEAEGKKFDRYSQKPFNDELRELDEIQSAYYGLVGFLNSELVRLSHCPNLLITGDAGKGKSHMIGDIAKCRIQDVKPSILILGQQLMSNDNPRLQILNSIGLGDHQYHDLLSALNLIGEFLGERIFFEIDALNEGEGRSFWKHHLSEFVDELNHYPYIAFIASVRTSYSTLVLPDGFPDRTDIVKFEHRGFEGQENEVVEYFCENFGLDIPTVPLITPEFSSPQFLLVMCISLQSQGKTEFPKGSQGITNIYKSFTLEKSKSIQANRNLDVLPSFDFVEDALMFLLDNVELNFNSIPEDSARNIYNKYNAISYNELFFDLVQEGVLVVDNVYAREKRKFIEIVRLPYEKFANHLQAKKLLSSDVENVADLFKSNGRIYEFFKSINYIDEGIAESIAVLLPEMYGIEIFETTSTEFQKLRHYFRTFEDFISHIWIRSLVWRTGNAIDLDTCIPYIENTVNASGNIDFLYSIIIQFSFIDQHPFNALYLHELLLQRPMSERDPEWIPFFSSEFDKLDSGLFRIVDWILKSKQRHSMDSSNRYLVSILLTWMLSSPYEALRDASTISLVKLYERSPDELLPLLILFKDCDDLFIVERLYAVTYAVTMRCNNMESVLKLATFTFETLFENDTPPVHIMLRDYARGIIEYHNHLSDDSNINMSIVRPPYGSKPPLELPTNEEIEQLKIPYDKDGSRDERDYSSAVSAVISSQSGILKKQDFKYHIEHFGSISFTAEETFEQLIKSDLLDYKETLLELKSLANDIANVKEKIKKGPKRDWSNLDFQSIVIQVVDDNEELLDEEEMRWTEKVKAHKKKRNTELDRLNKEFTQLKFQLDDSLNSNEKYKLIITTYLSSIRNTNKNSYYNPNVKGYQNWIIKRVFDLGYDAYSCRHMDAILNYGLRNFKHVKYGGNARRIGRKYELLAANELFARLADNFYIKDHFGDYKERLCDIPRYDMSLHDIDPSVMYVNYEEHKDVVINRPANHIYNSWKIDNWIDWTEDIPIVENLLIFKDDDDDDHDEWIELKLWMSWDEPVKMGERKYHTDEKRLHLNYSGFFVEKSYTKHIVDFLISNSKSAFDFRSIDYYTIYDKEFYWSPIYKINQDLADSEGSGTWQDIGFLDAKIHLPYEDYLVSGVNFQSGNGHTKPSFWLFKSLELKHSNQEGVLIDSKNKPAIRWRQNTSSNLSIRKDLLLKFMKENNLALVWAFSGEKRQFEGEDNRTSVDRILKGAYYFDDDEKIVGSYTVSERY